MMDMANIDSSKIVIDLGCGDGRIMAEAKRRGSSAYGVELCPVLANISRKRDSGPVIEKDVFSIGFKDFENLNYKNIVLFWSLNIDNNTEQYLKQNWPQDTIITAGILKFPSLEIVKSIEIPDYKINTGGTLLLPDFDDLDILKQVKLWELLDILGGHIFSGEITMLGTELFLYKI